MHWEIYWYTHSLAVYAIIDTIRQAFAAARICGQT